MKRATEANESRAVYSLTRTQEIFSHAPKIEKKERD